MEYGICTPYQTKSTVKIYHGQIVQVRLLNGSVIAHLLEDVVLIWPPEFIDLMGGTVAFKLWFVRLSSDRTVRDGPLSGDIALCSWARH